MAEASPAAVPASAVLTHTPLLLQHQDLSSVFAHRATLSYPQHPARGTEQPAFTEQFLVMNKLISHGSNKV